YPERIVDALKYNSSDYINKILIVPQSDTIRRYFLRCLNGPYLLIDTSGRDPNKNIELYDLRTNQLMNVFKRYKFFLSILDREKPGVFAVSSDEKLLAYVAGPDIKIYLIENGLELSSLSCKNGGMVNVDFMKFVFNNEKLLIFKDEKTVAVWDIFNFVKEFIEFIPLEKYTTAGLVKQMTRIVIDPISENEPFTILNIRSYFNDNQIVWDKLDLKLNPSEHIITDSKPYAYGINDNNEIYEQKQYLILMLNSDFYFQDMLSILIQNKKTRLLIGYNTIQVWHKKRLEFISVINDNPETPELPHEKFKVIKLRYAENTDITTHTLFLEYYSNNAMDNIGWLNVVPEIIYFRNF
ncbi:5126_t:CDS:2, partial [Gigaspora rosea]